MKIAYTSHTSALKFLGVKFMAMLLAIVVLGIGSAAYANSNSPITARLLNNTEKFSIF